MALTKYLWPWSRPKTPETVKRMLLDFYRDHQSEIDQKHVSATQPLIYVSEGAFLFSENWEQGDERFGKPSFELRFGWMTATKQDPQRFRLCVHYDRFTLTLPFVASGIR